MNPYSHFSIPGLDRWLAWLSGTDLRLWLYGFEQLDRVVVFVHVAAAAILFGAILLVDLRLMGFARRLPLKDLAAIALPWAIWCGLAAIATGVLLLLFDPIAVGIHTYFVPKMVLIALGGLNAIGFHRFIRLDGAEKSPRKAGAAGALSLALWTAVYLCASLNATERISSSMSARVE